MSGFRIHKNGQAIKTLDDWFNLAPPKGKKKQWVDGRSAKELARAWCHNGQIKVPVDFEELVNNCPEFCGLELNDAIPEHESKFDSYKGEGRNHDLLFFGNRDNTSVIGSVEAKADERFDKTILKRIVAIKKKKNPRSKALKRTEELIDAIVGKPVFSDVLNLRYQLLTAVAGLLVEAKKQFRESNNNLCLLIIHEFVSGSCSSTNLETNSNDLDLFIKMLPNSEYDSIKCG